MRPSACAFFGSRCGRVKPRRLWGRTPYVHISTPRRFKHHQNSTQDPKKREERKKIVAGEDFRGPTQLQTPTPFGAPPFRPRTSMFFFHLCFFFVKKRPKDLLQFGPESVWPKSASALNNQGRKIDPSENRCVVDTVCTTCTHSLEKCGDQTIEIPRQHSMNVGLPNFTRHMMRQISAPPRFKSEFFN